ncbi:hypothetical protein [Methylophaga sp.]|uniref:hypothetical protein n=1 Tax=Methylophaga sp. TaxID=2024840 RepID=UPI00271DA108|nr:hypothetical protein [Methylophaga sp.]MDO8828203.1 hypothetical protein [Methylophaga sp.]
MNRFQPTYPEPCLVWDAFEIAQQHAAVRVDLGTATDVEQGFAKACEDPDLLDHEWAALTEQLTGLLNTLNPSGYWHAEVTHFGWRSRNGFKDFEADTGGRFLASILPATDCTFKVFVTEDGTVRLQSFHHDAPTGNEWYTVKPAQPWLNL